MKKCAKLTKNINKCNKYFAKFRNSFYDSFFLSAVVGKPEATTNHRATARTDGWRTDGRQMDGITDIL